MGKKWERVKRALGIGKKKQEEPQFEYSSMFEPGETSGGQVNPLFGMQEQKPKGRFDDLKAKQKRYMQLKGVAIRNDHRTEYNKLSREDIDKITKEERTHIKGWISSSGDKSSILRDKRSQEEILAQAAPNSNATESEKKNMKYKMEALKNHINGIVSMDSAFAKIPPISEPLTVYRGVNDQFIEFLLETNGFNKSKYMKRTGKDKSSPQTLDYEKLDKTGVMSKLVGKSFVDASFQSTTTNKGFAFGWGVGLHILKDKEQEAMAIAEEMIKPKKNEDGTIVQKTPEEIAEIKAYAEHQVLSQVGSHAGGHTIVIDLPAGTNAIFIDAAASETRGTGAEQNEVLLDRGMSYEIIDIRGGRGNFEIHVKAKPSIARKAVTAVE